MTEMYTYARGPPTPYIHAGLLLSRPIFASSYRIGGKAAVCAQAMDLHVDSQSCQQISVEVVPLGIYFCMQMTIAVPEARCLSIQLVSEPAKGSSRA